MLFKTRYHQHNAFSVQNAYLTKSLHIKNSESLIFYIEHFHFLNNVLKQLVSKKPLLDARVALSEYILCQAMHHFQGKTIFAFYTI